MKEIQERFMASCPARKANARRIRQIFLPMFFLAVLLAASLRPAEVRAEERYTADSNWQDKTVTVTDTQTGTVLDTLAVEGLRINPQLKGAGNTIWFVAYKETSDYKNENYLYSYDIPTGKYTRLKALPTDYSLYDVTLLYNGSVYVTGFNPSDNNCTYRYVVKSGKLKKVMEAAPVGRYKKFIVMDPTYTYGSWGTYPIYIYNSKSGKIKQVASRAGGSSRSSKNLYIAEVETSGYREPSNGLEYTIKKYVISSGKTKVMKTGLTAYHIAKITSKYVYHTRYGAAGTVYYRTTISSGKQVNISRAAFEKAVK